jgi:hypothetical protein
LPTFGRPITATTGSGMALVHQILNLSIVARENATGENGYQISAYQRASKAQSM